MKIAVNSPAPGEPMLVRLEGVLDADTAPSVIREFREIHRPGEDLLVDLSGTTFVSSAGISALLELRSLTVDDGGGFRITASSHPVERVIEITGLVEIFGLPKPRTGESDQPGPSL